VVLWLYPQNGDVASERPFVANNAKILATIWQQNLIKKGFLGIFGDILGILALLENI